MFNNTVIFKHLETFRDEFPVNLGFFVMIGIQAHFFFGGGGGAVMNLPK